MSTLPLGCLAVPVLVATLAAQTSAPRPAARPLAGDLRIPIHGAPADGPGTPSPLWAGGASFKVAFDDGFTFYPVLGSEVPHNLPVRWRTRAVTVGGEPIADLKNRVARHGPWRYELVTEGLVECYDVDARGIEQTFVFTARPCGVGDLTVVGSIESELSCADRPSRHAPIGFLAEDGSQLVTYGEATVFDAAGRSLPIGATVAERTITLTVPATWLAEAVYPVTLDPLTFATQLVTSPGNTATSSTAIGIENESPGANLMVAFTRAVSATDHDVYTILMDADLTTNRSTVYSDLTTANSDQDVQIAYVAGANRWLVGMRRDYTSGRTTLSTIRVYYHDRANRSLNSGVGVSIPMIGVQAFSRPALGGTQSGSSGEWGVLVYQRDVTSIRANTPNSEVIVVPIRATTAQFWSGYVAADFPVGTDYDREDPTVTPTSDGGTDGWLIGWSELHPGRFTDDWDVYAVRTDPVGARRGNAALLASYGSRNSRRPQLAGSSGEYMLVHEVTPNLTLLGADEIVARRIDWTSSQAIPSLGSVRVVATGTSATLGAIVLESLDSDSRTRSHWAFTYTRYRSGSPSPTRSAHIVRVGGTGGVTETASLHTSSTRSGGATSIAFDNQLGRFTAAYTVVATSAPYHPVYAAHLLYPSDALALGYGSGCGIARIGADEPYAGHRRFAVSLGVAPANVAATLLLSFGQGSLPLDPYGMTGCSLLLDSNQIFGAVNVGTGTGGSARAPLSLPDVPLVIGDLHAQWVYLSPGLNPAGAAVTGGLKIQIR